MKMKKNGFSLVEVMIAMTIGLIVLAATISIYITAIRGSTDNVRLTRLNYDMDSVMGLMINEIRRASHWSAQYWQNNSTNNPFMTDSTRLAILSGGTCLLYSYDSNNNANIDANEYFGFKLNGTNIEMRFSGTATTDCSDGVWEIVNLNSGSEQIQITGLTFSFDSVASENLMNGSKCLNKTTNLWYDTTCSQAHGDGNLSSGQTIAA
jgi:prepilin peptidase dependent protein B